VTILVTDGVEPPPQAAVQIQLNQTSYKAGDHVQVQLSEHLSWGYDLYAAIVMPDGNFFALKNTNDLFKP
jgi:hypothetical protein